MCSSAGDTATNQGRSNMATKADLAKIERLIKKAKNRTFKAFLIERKKKMERDIKIFGEAA